MVIETFTELAGWVLLAFLLGFGFGIWANQFCNDTETYYRPSRPENDEEERRHQHSCT